MDSDIVLSRGADGRMTASSISGFSVGGLALRQIFAELHHLLPILKQTIPLFLSTEATSISR
jgi:hypothetical protein